jgi:hypothetical protein
MRPLAGRREGPTCTPAGYNTLHATRHGEGTIMIERVLGRSGLCVSAPGLGCMGMSEFYDPSQMDDAESIRAKSQQLSVSWHEIRWQFPATSGHSLNLHRGNR